MPLPEQLQKVKKAKLKSFSCEALLFSAYSIIVCLIFRFFKKSKTAAKATVFNKYCF